MRAALERILQPLWSVPEVSKQVLLTLALLLTMVFPVEGRAALTAQEIIALAQSQLTVPSEFVRGEMKVYRGETVVRSYSFVLGKLWDAETHTEYVRVDFMTAIDSSLGSSRYLLKRTAYTSPAQWVYLPALRRVRITAYRSDDPLLQSDYLFYDLTTIQDFADYRYRFVDPNEQAPVIEGEPQRALVPYQRTLFELEQRDGTYIVTGAKYMARDEEREARFLEFAEIAPGRFRPQKVVIRAKGGRTEFVFSHWVLSPPEPRLFTPTSLGTKTLTLPEDNGEGEKASEPLR